MFSSRKKGLTKIESKLLLITSKSSKKRARAAKDGKVRNRRRMREKTSGKGSSKESVANLGPSRHLKQKLCW